GGIPGEHGIGERRVALVPDGVKRLVELGVEVRVERNAGAEAGFLDPEYESAGATIAPDVFAHADVICMVQRPSDEEVGRLREGQTLVALLQPLMSPELVQSLANPRVTAFSMDSIPRSTRAQPMDALSSQSTVSGYKAVLLAASHLSKFFPMLTT